MQSVCRIICETFRRGESIRHYTSRWRSKVFAGPRAHYAERLSILMILCVQITVSQYCFRSANTVPVAGGNSDVNLLAERSRNRASRSRKNELCSSRDDYTLPEKRPANREAMTDTSLRENRPLCRFARLLATEVKICFAERSVCAAGE